jgi:hypothetical protein
MQVLMLLCTNNPHYRQLTVNDLTEQEPCTKLDIYCFITIIGSILLLVDYIFITIIGSILLLVDYILTEQEPFPNINLGELQ